MYAPQNSRLITVESSKNEKKKRVLLTGHRRLTGIESETTSKSLSLSAFSIAGPPPTHRQTRARASSNLSPLLSPGMSLRIF